MSKTYIIAEAGVNHNGKLDLALKLCDAAKECGADAIKFQTWKTEEIVTKSAALARYQHENINSKSQNQFEMLKALELSYDDFRIIQTYCKRIGIEFLSTPDEEYSLQFLSTLNLPFIKLGSGEVTNIPYLKKVGALKKDVLLSTGMTYLSDVDIAYRTLLESGATSVSLMHCTTNYPCPMNEVNLQAMQTLKYAFNCKVGYSDHTMGIEIPIAAVAMGAEIIEKHFTLDQEMDGPDHKASLNPMQLKDMIAAIRNIEKALGDGIKRPNKSELEISKVVLKRIVANCPIHKGEILTEEKLTVKRSSYGINANLWETIIGSQALYDFNTDEPIRIK